MIHYSAGVAKVRSIMLNISEICNPIVRKDCRTAIYKAMEADVSALSGVNLTPAEERVMANFHGWLNDAVVQSRCLEIQSPRSGVLGRVLSPIFFYVNLSTGTNLTFVLCEHVNGNWVTDIGMDMERTLVSLS